MSELGKWLLLCLYCGTLFIFINIVSYWVSILAYTPYIWLSVILWCLVNFIGFFSLLGAIWMIYGNGKLNG